MTPKTINISYTTEDGTTHSREYTDLSQVWHPASEPPEPNKDIIVAAYNDEHNRRDIWHISLTPDIIADFSRETKLRWAYVNDLLPSASCSGIPNNSSTKSNSWELLRPTLK